ncbi:tRNA-dihydrouridine(47) synthase [NAD(P)(+)] [Fulvia fulva]|uniref:tRNA-dihydrouridine(47) synthase [NAD(P)(+)] n=1 Tax=Passalora fulva TaxID=5499 RepID=A0A9Q8PHN0_PASFU|nr:tRNA-dihydrouridine(47) synthase [NAD(P)(+)] [Fulvia fulva]KAK4626445.1 tRNA-dihydrouridine(47) synthase [NAD(P)(+)] [Fulvia fulva]KAK4627458.1 tRNA-dihydrouridine(47) synthase [NAD(P)(+)] [Fulvia fulva]UJO22595.1 tRNA-dihydrouridine(47) synthase [NAD(P)(+)] [Fulvia fulva]WPV13945.1 tRNA-dihydrouridine(47) synthase [NAD(P)(+)] [Fulvia fulva]WPV28107.1 tRNA-dihydrouridine(47) synthase [NAD(P)(+)] [Fulvia fulva]
MADAGNPLEPSVSLQSKPDPNNHPQSEPLPGDSATTKAEKIERHGKPDDSQPANQFGESPAKRVKLDSETTSATNGSSPDQTERMKGVAPIKKEYLIQVGKGNWSDAQYDDDAAEGRDARDSGQGQAAGRGGQKTKGGQNKSRQFGSSRDAIELCRSRQTASEFAPITCSFGEKCKHAHDIRKYLKDGKREDLQTFNDGTCPVFEVKGRCKAGWRCRFAGSHSKEVEHEDGRKELVQLIRGEDGEVKGNDQAQQQDEDWESANGIVNTVDYKDKITLKKKKRPTPKSEKYLKWLEKYTFGDEGKKPHSNGNATNGDDEKKDNNANYIEQPPRPSEKRRLYYGPETPVLAPLTTQGNLPFRRLCVELGAQITWSEMAMGLPLLQGENQEWALMKAHESELAPPAFYPKNVVHDYDNSKDIRFGAQIAGNKPWLAVKTTEALTSLLPNLRAIDLNCGCPIDLVFRQGAGSALLDAPGKLEKILRGMNTVSGEVPITVKIRMGTKDKAPNADKLCQRLIMGGLDSQDGNLGPAGVAAITLHGRSRQQRYTRSADWEYIAECASLVKKLKAERADATDTSREPDARDLPATNDGMPYFCGNGDILSHADWNNQMEHAGVDSAMIGRGALVKPWIFEEIQSNQYLDKSATERLGYIEKFCRNGLEYWGSDEIGVGNVRRFLLEWLSFSCRYVPIGLLEYLPPKFGDRPPAFRGRSELETLLSSGNYKDWIKISEMFLGPAHKDFQFQPKHKSNSYEIEAEG